MDNKPTLSFSNASLNKLALYFDFELIFEERVFEDWFSFKYHLSANELDTLRSLIEKHRLKLPAYTEEKLKVKFITPILNLVDFYQDQLDDWYEVEMKQEFEHVILKGIVDYLVAEGSAVPKLPYFFLQEFKYTFPDKDPKYQLLAEMIAALEMNPSHEMKGGFIVGALWYFALLRKVEERYFFYISPGYNALDFEDLQYIFTILQSVKAEALEAITNMTAQKKINP